MITVERYFQLNEAFVLRVSFDVGIEEPHRVVMLFKGRYKGPDETDFENGVLATFPPNEDGENFAIKVAKNINLFI